jgi:hypothetical protein
MPDLYALVAETRNHPGLYATIAKLSPPDALVYLNSYCGTGFSETEDVDVVCSGLIAVLKSRRDVRAQ